MDVTSDRYLQRVVPAWKGGLTYSEELDVGLTLGVRLFIPELSLVKCLLRQKRVRTLLNVALGQGPRSLSLFKRW